MDRELKKFEYIEDKNFFEDLLLKNCDLLSKESFEKMFDFRNPIVKRKEFSKFVTNDSRR